MPKLTILRGPNPLDRVAIARKHGWTDADDAVFVRVNESAVATGLVGHEAWSLVYEHTAAIKAVAQTMALGRDVVVDNAHIRNASWSPYAWLAAAQRLGSSASHEIEIITVWPYELGSPLDVDYSKMHVVATALARLGSASSVASIKHEFANFEPTQREFNSDLGGGLTLDHVIPPIIRVEYREALFDVAS